MEDIFEEPGEIEIMKMEAEQKIILKELKIKLAIENYNKIMDNGIDAEEMIRHGIEITELTNTLIQMLDIFVELEEYEKCSKIKELLSQFNSNI